MFFFVLCCALADKYQISFKYFQNFILRLCICICLTFMCIKQTVQGTEESKPSRIVTLLLVNYCCLACMFLDLTGLFFFFILFSDVMIDCMLTLQTTTNEKNNINFLSMNNYKEMPSLCDQCDYFASCFCSSFKWHLHCF